MRTIIINGSSASVAAMNFRFAPYLFIATPLAVFAQTAVAADFLSIEDAQHQMFPHATSFEPTLIAADPQRLAQLGISPGSLATARFFSAKQGDQVVGVFVADAVIGKFQMINYAVAFDTSGNISDVEIMSYREAHGAEVRNASWRQQFVGKSATQPLAVGDDIDNISGATLSCTHLTDGIRKLARVLQQHSHA